MQKLKIINAKIVNEGEIQKTEILIIGARNCCYWFQYQG